MKKVTNQLNISVSQGSFVDEGEGVVSFPNGLTITDGTVQRNGTKYDIDTLEVGRYGNQLTGDHKDELGNLIGETIGVIKSDGKVIVNKIRYAINENPYARLAYNLLVGGFSKNFSTETIGPQPDPATGIYWNAELVGLSQVVTQNNYNAHINKVVHNSLEQSKADGLDVDHNQLLQKVVNDIQESEAPKEKEKMEEKNKKVEVEATETVTEEVLTKNIETQEEAQAEVEVKENEVTSEEVKTEKESTDKSEESEEAISTDDKAENGYNLTEETVTKTTRSEYIQTEEEKEQQKKREAQWDEPVVKETPTPPTVIVVNTEDKTEESVKNKQETKKETNMEEKTSNSLTAEQVAEIVNNAIKPFATQIDELKTDAKNAFDASAKEPEFQKAENAVEEVEKNDYKSMAFEDRYQLQVDAAWNAVKLNNVEAWETLREINSVNLDKLKEAGIAKNAIGLEELGNFVIAPEMYTEIVGHRNDYTGLLNATEWKETMSLEFAWLKRVGDIDMQSVAMQSSTSESDENLKPISDYSAVPIKSALEELAAVTVVATSATRFAAVDLLSDAAAGYRNDYDRKRAQLVIAKLEAAVDETGYSTAYNPSEDVDALTTLIDAITDISDTTLNGTLVFTARTFAEIKSRALKAGANGPLSEILTTGEMPTLFGYKFVVVPNDLMPSLGGSENISHVVEGDSVTINHAVYFANLTSFTGRTSGGLMYDVSNSASYEVNGSTRSAYQRNELVLRGSFFRGGAIKDIQVVAGVRQGNSANVS